jgi:hypothetical protein
MCAARLLPVALAISVVALVAAPENPATDLKAIRFAKLITGSGQILNNAVESFRMIASEPWAPTRQRRPARPTRSI